MEVSKKLHPNFLVDSHVLQNRSISPDEATGSITRSTLWQNDRTWQPLYIGGNGDEFVGPDPFVQVKAAFTIGRGISPDPIPILVYQIVIFPLFIILSFVSFCSFCFIISASVLLILERIIFIV